VKNFACGILGEHTLGRDRFRETSWFDILADALGSDRRQLVVRLKDFRDRNGGKNSISEEQIGNWAKSGPGATVRSRAARFLLKFLADMKKRDLIVDEEMAGELGLFLKGVGRKNSGSVPGTHEEAAIADNMEALFGFFLGRSPGQSRTPKKRGGFHLVLRRQYYGPSIYQELMYVGDNAGAPSYLITYSGRVLIGRVMFDGRRKAYGFFGAPYEDERGYSIRMLTMHFPERPTRKPSIGMIARITSNKGMSTTSRTAYWRLSEQDEDLERILSIFLNSMKKVREVSLEPEIPVAISQFVREYKEDHPVYKRLVAHLPEPDKLSDQGALADDWAGEHSEPTIDQLLGHNYPHGDPPSDV